MMYKEAGVTRFSLLSKYLMEKTEISLALQLSPCCGTQVKSQQVFSAL
jgi:hypothetical protein